jgi:hypothetical protein
VRKAESQRRRSPVYANQEAPSDEAVGETPVEPLQPDKLVEALLAVLLAHPDLVPQVSRTLDPKWLADLEGAALLQQLMDAHAHDAWQDASQFLEECDERSKDYLAGLLLRDTEGSGIPADISHLGETGLRYERYRSAIGNQESNPSDLAQSFVQLLEVRWHRQRLQILEQSVKSGLLTLPEVAAAMEEMRAIKGRIPPI